MRPTRWLIDKSVLWRLNLKPVLAVVHHSWPRSGQRHHRVGSGDSARSTADFELTRRDMIGPLVPVAMPYRAEQRAREVQASLVERGQHRSAGVADLLVAAIAELEGLTVLHYDADFDVIAEVTGQPTEWVVPRGTVP